MEDHLLTKRVLKHIAAHRSRPSVRLLDVLYGPKSLSLRTRVAALMLGRKVTGSDKIAQYNNLRSALMNMLGIPRMCAVGEDAAFESKAEELIQE